jgi:hypothetical protein
LPERRSERLAAERRVAADVIEEAVLLQDAKRAVGPGREWSGESDAKDVVAQDGARREQRELR